MNALKTTILVIFSFLFFSVTAFAETSPGQLPDANSTEQTDESAEFAAYEFEDDSADNDVKSENIKKTSNTGDNFSWNPEAWSEIP